MHTFDIFSIFGMKLCFNYITDNITQLRIITELYDQRVYCVSRNKKNKKDIHRERWEPFIFRAITYENITKKSQALSFHRISVISFCDKRLIRWRVTGKTSLVRVQSFHVFCLKAYWGFPEHLEALLTMCYET